MNTIHIHEFSTGIDFEGNPDNWVSKKFIGGYMNSTLDAIPAVVHNAIANEEFAISEAASREQAAIIGREVEGFGESWSVIAIVTRGKDNKGRGVSVYRYFLCCGLGKLPDIIFWWYQSKSPTFNPFDSQTRNYPHEFSNIDKKKGDLIQKFQDLLEDNSIPIIISYERKCSPLILNELATHITKNNEFISWAYNVEDLKKPNRFQVIYPASKNAERNLWKALENESSFVNSFAEEHPTNIAINSLISGKFKPEYVKTLEQNLSNNQITVEFWQQIFSQHGIQQAYKNYHGREAKLLTLQAIIIPETIVNFLTWLNESKNKESLYQESQELQMKIEQSIDIYNSPIGSNIFDSINICIVNLINNTQLESATLMILSKQGFWSSMYENQYIIGLRIDLDNRGRHKRNIEDLNKYLSKLPNKDNRPQKLYILNNTAWTKIRNELDSAWESLLTRNEKYFPLAKLFEDLANLKDKKNTTRNNLRFAVFFYHLSQGNIPNHIFKKCKKDKILISSDDKAKNDEARIFDIKVKRKIPLQEKIWKEVFDLRGGLRIPLLFHIIILMLTFLGGFLCKQFLSSLPSPSNSFSETTLSEAHKNFDITQTSINQIVNDLSQTTKSGNGKKPSTEEITEAFSKILDPNNYLGLKLNPDPDRWISAILNYQYFKVRDLPQKPDGIINPQGKTYNFLKCQLLQEIKLQASLETINTCKEFGFTKINPSSPSNSASTQQIRKAINDFPKTKISLEKLSKELANNLNLEEPKVKNKIIETFTNENSLSFANMTEETDIEKWVLAIQKYQNSLKIRTKNIKNISDDGIIDYNGNTYNLLKCDVAQRNGNILEPLPQICDSLKAN